MTTTTNTIQTTTETTKTCEPAAALRRPAGPLHRRLRDGGDAGARLRHPAVGGDQPEPDPAQGVLTVQASWYGGVNDFWARQFASWGWRYTPPALSWYNSATGNMYSTPCGFTMRNNGFYCSCNHRIYLDSNYMQALINSRGDYAAAGFIAHEWGHAIARLIGYGYSQPGGEYLADCLAGMSTRWGYLTGRLVGSDYYEFRGWLSSQISSASHGTGANRAAWFDFGYSQYNVNQCARALPARSATMAASATQPQTALRGPGRWTPGWPGPAGAFPAPQMGYRGP